MKTLSLFLAITFSVLSAQAQVVAEATCEIKKQKAYDKEATVVYKDTVPLFQGRAYTNALMSHVDQLANGEAVRFSVFLEGTEIKLNICLIDTLSCASTKVKWGSAGHVEFDESKRQVLTLACDFLKK